MASVRVHTRITAPADDVWKIVSDASSIADWFGPIVRSAVTGTTRTVELANGPVIEEDIVTNDQVLRRFQYSIRSGLPVESHLGTIDVLEDGAGSLVVYSTDVKPDEVGSMLAGVLSEALQGLKEYAESRA